MPPRGDMITMEDPIVSRSSTSSSSPQPQRSSSDAETTKKKHRSRSSKEKRSKEKSSSISRRSEKKQQQPQDDGDGNDEQRRRHRGRSSSVGQDKEVQQQQNQSQSKSKSKSRTKKDKSKKKSSSGDKKKSKKKSSSSHPNNEPSAPGDDMNNNNKRSYSNNRSNQPPPPTNNSNNNNKVQQEGVTVSNFMQQQQSMQDEASSRKNNTTMRQRMANEQREQQMMASDPSSVHNQESETTHYFDDEASEYDMRDGGAVVARNNRIPANQQTNNSSSQQQQQVVDTIPADHPSSSIIQTHRTCTLCHRTLPRSQFSERDRYSVHLSLAPGATCRTCSMTVCAVRLKSMPGTEQLLLEYAQRGLLQAGMMALGNGGYPALEGGDANLSEQQQHQQQREQMIVRRNSMFSTASGITGKELTLYGSASIIGADGRNDPNGSSIMGMPKDINTTFSTDKPYASTDADRPTQIADCKYIDALLKMPCYLNLNAFGLFQSSRDVSVSLAALEAARVYGTLGDGYFAPHDCDGRAVPAIPESGKGDGTRGRRASAETQEATNGSSSAQDNVNPKQIVCLVLNEGATARTAILASQHYGWTTVSIDPLLSEEWDGYHDDIPGFTGYSGSIKDFMDNGGEFAETMIEFRRQSVQHLVIIGVQHEKDSLRLKGNGHINEIRSRYEDVPTTLVSLSPVRKATLAPQRRMGQCGSKLEKDVGYEPNCSYIDEGVFSECRMVEVWNFHNAEDDGSDGEDEGEYSDDGGEYEDEAGHGGYRKESTEAEGDYVQSHNNRLDQKEKQKQQHQRAGHKHEQFEEQLKKLSGSPKASRKTLSESPGRNKDNSGEPKTKKNSWLEKKVAQHKKKQPDELEEVHVQNAQESMSTLGTKETYERSYEKLPSNEYVKNDSQEGNIREMKIQGKRLGENNVEDQDDRVEEKDEHHQEEEEDNNNDDVAVWSPPDEEVSNQVWEKALAKHDEQESLVNQFEHYYGQQDENHQGEQHEDGHQQGQDDQYPDEHQQHQMNNHQHQDDHQDNHPQEEAYDPENPNAGLPPGWEAIQDASSGDYYYNNWETGEVTWDRPVGELHHDGEYQVDREDPNVPPSPLEDGGVEDQHDDYSQDDGHGNDDDRSAGSDSSGYGQKKPAATAAVAAAAAIGATETSNHDSSDENAPPLVQYAGYSQSKTKSNQSFDDMHSENEDSNYVFDDQSSTSSGIAALSRWNKPVSNSGTTPLGKSHTSGGSAEEDDDMIVWSDDEQENEEACDVVEKSLQRSGSNVSNRQKPWHKKDSTDNSIGGDSFIYD